MQNAQETSQELVRLEKKYWQAMQDQDLETALALTDFPCLVAGAHGARSVDREGFIAMFNSQRETVRSFRFESEPQVRVLDDDTAVVAYRVRSVVDAQGERKEYDAVDTSTWVKRDGKWACALHTETEFANPH